MPRNNAHQWNLANLIGETTAYEKKLTLEERHPKSLCKSISAFANGSGGTLIFGIADDGTIAWLDNPEYVADKASEIIKSRLDPVPEFQLRFEEIEGKTLVEVANRG